MKKLIIFLFSFTILSNILFSNPASNVKEIRLENGFSLFTLEDYSSPLINIEFITKAGISSQNINTAGFFTLYARILKANLSTLDNLEIECNSDSTRYSLQILPSEIKTTLNLLSETFFSPIFTDEIIRTELSNLKNEVIENESSLAGFINAAIDSRVFSEAPWKHDSGIYPALFSKIDYNQARNTLNEISEKYYTPQNSALFINGNIDTEYVKTIVELTFGVYYSSTGLPIEQPVKNSNEQKKYVIHHPEISNEMTQIVLQYNEISSDQCDLLSNLLNQDYSTYKINLLKDQSLGILGSEYINVAAAHKKDSSRMIIQSLLQNNSFVSDYNQCIKFINNTEKSLNNISDAEFIFAKKNLTNNSNFIFENSSVFMHQIASYWAIKDFDDFNPDNKNYTVYQNSPTTASMMSRNERIENISQEFIRQTIEKKSPFVFIIMNSKNFEKNKKDFLRDGFEEISTTNASWYSQELFNQIRIEALDKFTNLDKKQSSLSEGQNPNLFYENNKNTVKVINLSNKIPVYVKENSNSAYTTILLNIEGGKLKSPENNGFEELLINLLASNIQIELANKISEGKLRGQTPIYTNVKLTSSEIIIECYSDDFAECVNAISNAILYREVIPATADRIVANLQYKKRLENGDSNYQIFAHTINQLYGKKNLYNVFEAEKDILVKTNFDEISEKYADFLNASRFSFVITGSVPPEFQQILQREFSQIPSATKISAPIELPVFPHKSQVYVKLNHTFLTDIPASKAGRMPAKLIPTTEFIDPVVYVFKKPESLNEQYLCSAFISYICKNYSEILNRNNINIPLKPANTTSANRNFTPKDIAISVPANSDLLQIQTIIIKNAARAKEIESIYINETLMVLRKFATMQNSEEILNKIKNSWYSDHFSDCNSNTGIAQQINSSLIKTNQTNPEDYINAYNVIQEATAEDFIKVIEKFFIRPQLIVYSNDVKK